MYQLSTIVMQPPNNGTETESGNDASLSNSRGMAERTDCRTIVMWPHNSSTETQSATMRP